MMVGQLYIDILLASLSLSLLPSYHAKTLNDLYDEKIKRKKKKGTRVRKSKNLLLPKSEFCNTVIDPDMSDF